MVWMGRDKHIFIRKSELISMKLSEIKMGVILGENSPNKTHQPLGTTGCN